MLLRLMASLGLDTNPFNRGLDQAKAQAKKSGTEISANLSGAFKAGAGILTGGAIIGAINKVKAAYADLAKDAKESGKLLTGGELQQAGEVAGGFDNTILELKRLLLPVVFGLSKIIQGLERTVRLVVAAVSNPLSPIKAMGLKLSEFGAEDEATQRKIAFQNNVELGERSSDAVQERARNRALVGRSMSALRAGRSTEALRLARQVPGLMREKEESESSMSEKDREALDYLRQIAEASKSTAKNTGNAQPQFR